MVEQYTKQHNKQENMQARGQIYFHIAHHWLHGWPYIFGQITNLQKLTYCMYIHSCKLIRYSSDESLHHK